MSRRALGAALLSTLALVGCNAILGIEDRHLAKPVPSGDAGAGGMPAQVECLPDATALRTGYIQVDGLLDAADTMVDQFESIESDFQSSILVMAASFNIDTDDGYTSDLVDAVIAALAGQVTQFTEHGLSVFIPEVRCSADVARALEQQNACEEASGCDTSVPSTELECQGICRGDCSARCDSCRAPVDGRCLGGCLGSCELKVAQACPGACHGMCSGTCVALDENGDCQGSCDGDCSGTCEFFEPGGCGDTCVGECESLVNGKCESGASCAGTCDTLLREGTAACNGDCTGRAIPIPGDAECVLGELCKLQSSLLGSMRMSCQAASITEGHTIKPAAPKAAAAQFEARLTSVVATSSEILAGLAVVEVIAAGQLVGRTLTNPTPYDLTYEALKDIADRAEREQPIPGVPEECSRAIAPFVAPIVERLATLRARGTALVSDQLKYVLALQAGFR